MRNICILTAALLAGGAAFADWDYAADELANRTPFAGTATREAVQDSLAKAIVSGDVIGKSGGPMNRESPAYYPQKPKAAGLRREQVVAELDRAMREGDMLTMDQSGLTYKERFPTQFARTAQPVELQAMKSAD